MINLTPQQIQLVKKTWGVFRQVQPQVFGDVFYHKLFLDYPALRNLYPKDMNEPYDQLMTFVSIVVSRLERPQELKSALLTMIPPSPWSTTDHCQKLGDTLRWTLQHGLGADWNGQVDQAWGQCVNLVIDQLFTP